MTILLLADHDGHTLGDATARAVSAARDMGGAIHVLVAGENVGPITQVAANVSGVDKVLVADDPALAHLLAEPVADLLVGLSADYAAVIAPATSIGKDILPRVAARRDVMQVSDITRVIAADTFERPVYAGNAIETVQSTDVLKVVTIRSSAFDAAPQGSVAAPVESVSLPARAWKARFVSEELTKSERPELTSARIVVSGGRGLGSAQAFQTVSRRWPSAGMRPSGRPARRWTPATRPMTCRWGRQARSSPPSFMSPSVFPARSSISPA